MPLDNTTVYLDFTKFATFNESMPSVQLSNWEVIITDIYAVFVTYDVLQWFLSFLVFFTVFMLLRKETFLNLTDTQVLTLSSFVVIGMNSLLLFYNIFSIIQPIQMFVIIWLGGILFILGKKN